MTPERWQQVRAMLAGALERAPADRAAYLEQVSIDPSLRREVESLLAQEKGAEGFLEAPALEVAAKMLGQGPGQSLIGAQIGSYQVLSLLGVGGMGEVYQAHDTKLGREVAIKVLPAGFVDDPERLSRFQREARMLAALNHPNIATIYGLEQSGGAHYLVMELVLGETLAERLGALKIEEALKIAVQIAEALEAAHEKGVIHRDLKPANVKVTPEGRVKVLDFGLAKAFGGDGGLDFSNAPTLTVAGTEEGRILGTPAYMSPEQARGRPVDKRTDIWAFGCVLYELLTGRQAFHGDTISDIIASILEREPHWQVLPASTPVKIRELLGRCLQKDLRRRLHDAADARIEIEEALAAPVTAEPAAPMTVVRALGRREMILGVGVLLLVAVVSGLAIWNLKPAPPSPRPVSRLTIVLSPGQELAVPDNGPALALSPDGSHIAYVARQGLTQQVYLRTIDSLQARPIPSTEGPVVGNNFIEPFFSPDSQWMGFFAGGKLKKVSVSGGAALTLCDSSTSDGASWSSQGMIAFAPGPIPFLQQVSDVGGAPQPLTRIEKGETVHSWPEFLPGGKALLFGAAMGGSWSNGQIAVQTVGAAEHRNLIQGGMYPHYAPSGHIVYVQGGTLMAVPFDPQRLAVTGAAVPMIEGILQSTTDGDAQYSFSANGSLAYIPGAAQSAQSKLVWVNRNGAEQPLAAPEHAYVNPRISPDGRRIAVGITEQERQVWLYDVSRGTLTRLTFQGDNNLVPFWTPDGRRIAFTSNKEGPRNLFWQLADGSGGLERLTTSESVQLPGSWSPGGELLAFTEVNLTTGYDIWVLRLSDRKAQPLLQTQFNESTPQFSPDGRWLAYVSDESGRKEIYVQPYPGPGGKWQISAEGGVEPLWNRNGRELFYRSGKKMMAVEISTKPSFSAGTPKMLFEGVYQLLAAISTPNYDVSPDGQRFLMLKPVESAQAAPTQINVVLNWFEELKQKVPTGKK
jgi:eukaryotic-like serine/threonine-protein kinase